MISKENIGIIARSPGDLSIIYFSIISDIDNMHVFDGRSNKLILLVSHETLEFRLVLKFPRGETEQLMSINCREISFRLEFSRFVSCLYCKGNGTFVVLY